MQNKISELNRLLLAIKELMDNHYAASISDVIEQCKSIVIDSIMPDHDETINFAGKLGLIRKGTKKMYLLDSGQHFLAMNEENIYELTVEQKKYILRTCFLHGFFRKDTMNLLNKFSKIYKNNTFRWSEVDDSPLEADGWFIDHLIELELLNRIENSLEVSAQYVDTVSSFLSEGKGWTIAAFEKWFEEKKEVGDVAERMVFDYESNRLANLGYEVEAKCVRIISRLRVNAGYDIESFNDASPGMNFDRFIEVKGSKSQFIRFFWTDNEMAVAKELGEKYWIYFQGGIDIKNGIVKNDPLVFQDPLNSILKDSELTKTPQGFIIEGKIHGKELSRSIK